jgi:enoyl-CoA hydratase/carnithine racemase
VLGEFLPAERAAEIGLVNRVVSENSLAEEAMKMARKIAEKSSAAVKIGKEALYRQIEMSLDEAYEYAGWAMAENMMARDAEAGIGAFVNKRPLPKWMGE